MSRRPHAESDFVPIEDHAAIGDCASVALVTRRGCIDWLCWPRFDSPACFAALLDPERGGHFRLGPAHEPLVITRRYVGDTNVLETVLETHGGRLRLRDLMPVAEAAEYDRTFWPEHQILREVTCLEGEVEVDLECAPRFEYGRRAERAHDRGACGFVFVRRGAALVLRSEMPLRQAPERAALVARERLRAGERRFVSLSFDQEEPATLPPLGEAAARRVEVTLAWWRGWAGRCAYEGPHRREVVRSALTLKLLSFAASGAVVAAPTTSLPERPGGVRNWDYRFCWLRDASLTLHALLELGYVEEGVAFFAWLLYTTRHTAPQLEVLYDVHGRPRHAERELPHLRGYLDSRPVRVGNEAANQLQLDNYGILLATAAEFVERGGRLGRWQARLLARLGEAICRHWREPDHGIWEIRTRRRRHTHSNVMCWVGLERLLRLAARGEVRVPVERYRAVAAEIAAEVERQAWNDAIGSYVSWLGGDEVDASLLLLPIYGYADAGGVRMRGTYDAIRKRLETRGLLRRYPQRWDDGLPPGEGAFGICSFWQVEVLALRGDLAEARRLFEHVSGHANDVGLFAEEIDPGTGRALGNFPQAFTHLGQISAALTLAECGGERTPAAGQKPGGAEAAEP